MNSVIDRIAYCIKNEIKQKDHEQCIMFYGSYGRKEHDFYSDSK